MDWLFDADWRTVLAPGTAVAEIVARGSLVYLGMFMLFRLVLKRQSGALGVSDLLVVVLVADAAQNGLADNYRSVPDGLLLVGVIVFWAWFLDWLGFRFPLIQRLVKPPTLPIVRDGRLLRRNMKLELITEDELMSQLRLQGIDHLSQVRRASVEPDGRISVVKAEGKGGSDTTEGRSY